MSVSNQTNKTYGSGNGVTTTFSFPFKIFDVSELVAYIIDDETGDVTGPLTYTTEFSATINAVTEGGSVTFVTAPAIGETWFLKRVVPYTQTAVLLSGGTLPGRQVENQLDLSLMMIIQIAEEVSRAMKLPTTFVGDLPEIPLPVAGTVLGWNEDGTALINMVVGDLGADLSIVIGSGDAKKLVRVNAGESATELVSLSEALGDLPDLTPPLGLTDEIFVKDVSDDDNVKATAISELLKLVFPIGALYFSGVSTNPATLFGFGTWTAIEGKVIVGKAASGTFDTLDATLGAETHTHTGTTDASGDSQVLTVSGGGACPTQNHLHTFTTGAGNSIQPSIVKYIWQRTA